MNAPDATCIDFTAAFEHPPLNCMVPSATHVQRLRRQRYDAQGLLELAATIKANGVVEPIVVRPWTGSNVTTGNGIAPKYEIVAGERRWLAADRAGLAHIPAIIRDLSDEQVLEIQLVENLQREGLHPLEEGAGYQELMALKKIDAEAVGAMVGKSRSYVYTRTKLLDLCPAARDALQAGEIDASQALLLARVQGDKLQTKALKLFTDAGHHYSYREMARRLHEGFMTPLAGAPFAADDATLAARDHSALPACTTCPHRSGNDAELLDELDGDANVCTDRPCFDTKTQAHWKRRRIEIIAAGKTIIGGDAAKMITPGPYDQGIGNGHIDLDAPCTDSEPDNTPPGWQPPTYRTLLQDAGLDVIVAEGKGGALRELVPAAAAARALDKTHGIKLPSWRLKPRGSATDGDAPLDNGAAAAELAREEEQRKVEIEYRKRLFAEIFKKWKGPIRRPDLERLAEFVRQTIDDNETLDAVMPNQWQITKTSEADLLRYCCCAMLTDDIYLAHGKPGMLLETAQRLKIDPKKIRAVVIADLKPTSVAPEDKPKPTAKKKATKK